MARFHEKVKPGKIFMMVLLWMYQSSLPALGGEIPGGLLSAEPTIASMPAG
jgi:hypothetical protein